MTTPPTTGSATGTNPDGSGTERGERGSKSVKRGSECGGGERGGDVERGAESGVKTA